ncbi:hypothetical protein BOX15_Mlig013867g4, partial [Macrostomum lignano]
ATQPSSGKGHCGSSGAGVGASEPTGSSGVAANSRVELDASSPSVRLSHRQSRLYADAVSVFRAQGPLTDTKRDLLRRLRSLLGVSDVRHQVECRRAVADPELATIAARTAVASTNRSLPVPNEADWDEEASRAAPLVHVAATVASAKQQKKPELTADSPSDSAGADAAAGPAAEPPTTTQQEVHQLPTSSATPSSAPASPPVNDLISIPDPLPAMSSTASVLPSAVASLHPSAYASTFTWASTSVDSFGLQKLDHKNSTSSSSSHNRVAAAKLLKTSTTVTAVAKSTTVPATAMAVTSNGTNSKPNTDQRRKQQFRRVALLVANDNSSRGGLGFASIQQEADSTATIAGTKRPYSRIKSSMEMLLESDSDEEFTADIDEDQREDIDQLHSLVNEQQQQQQQQTVVVDPAVILTSAAVRQSLTRPVPSGGKVRR